MQEQRISIVGGGLAGCEAAWQAARLGVPVVLYEMKPKQFSPAHSSPALAELICSNSFRGAALENAVGLLKEEMRSVGTLFMEAALATAIPAGGALAVDRDRFSQYITEALEASSTITVVREEVNEIRTERPLIIASGPLTSAALAASIQQLVGEKYLSFYDAISPVVEAESIDMSIAFRASRYGRGGDDYINCPLSRDDYYRFVTEVVNAEKAPLHDFEQALFFEGCLPIEEMATRGKNTLSFGPMKPVGLTDPRTEKQPFAVVQLRPENAEGTLYNMVGFQTRMTWGEQKRVFRLIPGLEHVQFVRLGSCHRNSFINAPRLLNTTLQLVKEQGVFFAGQISGVEGYVESAAMGMLAGINAARQVLGESLMSPPATTAVGALMTHITGSNPETFQPMNVNFGLFPPLERRVKKKERRRLMSERALQDIAAWRQRIEN